MFRKLTSSFVNSLQYKQLTRASAEVKDREPGIWAKNQSVCIEGKQKGRERESVCVLITVLGGEGKTNEMGEEERNKMR